MSYISKNEQDFINSHSEIPLKYINNMDPFDYIQNWSRFRKTKNLHAQFSFIINSIPFFYLNEYPMNNSDIFIEYEFEDKKILRTKYLQSIVVEDEIGPEFDNYFINFAKTIKAPFKLPPLDEIKDNFLIFKGLKKKKILKVEEEIIKWDRQYNEDNNFIKCRVDNKNQVNVLVQNTFYLNTDEVIPLAFDCARLFYSNNYPLILIESKNHGGYIFLALLMQQILQIRTADRGGKFSFRLNEKTKEYFKHIYEDSILTDIQSCSVTTNLDLKRVTDHYSYNNLEIEHNRSNIFDLVNPSYRDAFNNFRDEFKDSPNIKNPTDIIIFTDSYSFSSGSFFIKQFQITGGAIIAGFYGNPKIKGIDQFDASQSYSMVNDLDNTEISKKLGELGFLINGVTSGEFFDDTFHDNPIPNEYTFLPVDYRVDLYSDYSDDLYESFIQEGKKIHEKFNKDECNSKNKKLLLYSKECNKYEGTKEVKGGYKCGSNGKWDRTKCEYYFCEIGYYYDFYQNKCIKECTHNKKSFIIHENNIDKEFNIEANSTSEFLYYNSERYYCFFETSEKQITSLPKIFFLTHAQSLIINNKNSSNLIIRIKGINSIINPYLFVNIYNIGHYELLDIYFLKGKQMHIIQFSEDSILYISNPLNASNLSIKISEYNKDMTENDILSINKNYYNDYLGDLVKLEQNKLYFIYLDSQQYEQINFYLVGNRSNVIKFTSYKQTILYLEKDKNYLLDVELIKDQKLNVAIKLVRKTINSEVFIKENNIKLNSNNLYYELTIKENLNLEIRKDNALIEILFEIDANIIDIIDLEENKNTIKLSKEFNFIKIKKEHSSKIINFKLENGENSIFLVDPMYTKAPYILVHSISNYNKIPINNFTFNITDHYKGDIKLMKDEYYYVIIQTSTKGLTFKISMYDYEGINREENKKDDSSKKIIIIISIVSGVILILVIILAIYLVKIKKSYNQLEKEVNKISFKESKNEDKEDDIERLLE